jgi:predicted enzyme related to lactoylglutathione lyase
VGLSWGREELKESPGYTEFHLGDQGVGGMMAIEASWGDVPPHWIVYFQVADLDASAARVGSLGGKLRMEPTDIPEVGRFAIPLDPQGAEFAIIRLDRP